MGGKQKSVKNQENQQKRRRRFRNCTTLVFQNHPSGPAEDRCEWGFMKPPILTGHWEISRAIAWTQQLVDGKFENHSLNKGHFNERNHLGGVFFCFFPGIPQSYQNWGFHGGNGWYAFLGSRSYLQKQTYLTVWKPRVSPGKIHGCTILWHKIVEAGLLDWIFHSSSSNTRKKKTNGAGPWSKNWRRIRTAQHHFTVFCACFGAEIKLAESDSFPGPWFLDGDMNKAKLFKTGPLKRCKRTPKQVTMVFHGFIFTWFRELFGQIIQLYLHNETATLRLTKRDFFGWGYFWVRTWDEDAWNVFFLRWMWTPKPYAIYTYRPSSRSTLTWWFRIRKSRQKGLKTGWKFRNYLPRCYLQ